MLDLTGNLPCSLGLNDSIASNSCPGLQFSFGVNLFQMMVHRIDTNLKQIGHQLLRQPNAFIFKPALNARLPVLGPVEDETGCRKWWLGRMQYESGFFFTVKMYITMNKSG